MGDTTGPDQHKTGPIQAAYTNLDDITTSGCPGTGIYWRAGEYT